MSNGSGRDARTGAALDLREVARVFAHAPSAIAVVTGPEHTLRYANAAFRTLAAAGSWSAELGAPLPSGFGGVTRHALIRGLARASGSGAWRGVLHADMQGDPTGDAWPCAIWALDEDGAGNPAALVVEVDASTISALARLRFRDLTERVLLSTFREEDRADAADAARTAAEHASEARRQLVAALSHDLRTPLQAIGGYAQLVEAGALGPVTDRQRHALGRIQDAMQHVLSIATGLLDQEREPAEAARFAVQDVATANALEQAAALLQMQAETKGVLLRVAPGDRHLTVRADPGKLRQVLVNLLGNAVKFTARGGDVAAACEPVDSRTVAFRISDTGRGIASDDLARVFEPYVQVGGSPPAGEAGFGLGLAISHRLAEGMGGTLTVESVEGQGSTFTLSLPRANAEG